MAYTSVYTYTNKRCQWIWWVSESCPWNFFHMISPAWWSWNLSGARVIHSHVRGFLLVPGAWSQAHVLRLSGGTSSRRGRKGWAMRVYSSKCPFSFSCGLIEPSIFGYWWWIDCEWLVQARRGRDGGGRTRRGGGKISIILWYSKNMFMIQWDV